MLVVETVAAIADPASPACIIARDRLGIIQTDEDHSGLYVLQRSCVRRRRVQQSLPGLQNSVSISNEGVKRFATNISPDVAVLASKSAYCDAILFAGSLEDSLDLNLELCSSQLTSLWCRKRNLEEFVLPEEDDVIVFRRRELVRRIRGLDRVTARVEAERRH